MATVMATVLYVVGKVSDELRYSMRSLSNMPHDGVVVVGTPVPWLRNATFIPCPDRHRERARNVTEKVGEALAQLDAAEVILMWDDIIIAQPWECRGLHYAGSIDNKLATIRRMGYGPGNRYRKAVEATRQAFGGTARFCGTHHPHLFDRERLQATVERSLASPVCYELATAYGAMHGEEAGTVFIPSPNAKKIRWQEPTYPVISTNEEWERSRFYVSWRQRAFPHPSPWEGT